MRVIKIKEGKILIGKEINPFNIYFYIDEKGLEFFYKKIKKSYLILDLDSIKDNSFEGECDYNWEEMKESNITIIGSFSIRNLLLVEKGLDFMDFNLINES